MAQITMAQEIRLPSDSKAQKLSEATELALDRLIEMLSLPIDLTDPKCDLRLVAQVKDVALQVVSQQIRVDEQRLRQHEGEQLIEYEQAVARQEKLLGLRPTPSGKAKAKTKASD